MMSNEPQNALYSVSQVMDHVFPYMDRVAIHLMMKKRVVTPYRYARGRYGSRLTVSDVATIGIAHTLSSLGATFHELQPGAGEGELYFADTTWPDERQIRARNEDRPIQRFLEHSGYV